jgi:hypothetical protein
MKTDKLQHNPQTLAVTKQLRKVDGFMYGGESIKSALDQAFDTGMIGFFALDCVVSEPVATEAGIGKVPLTVPETIQEFSGILWQEESMKHVTNVLVDAGLQVSWWAFIGDDDFIHSVSPPWSIVNDKISSAIASQTESLKAKINPSLGKFELQGWFSVEQFDFQIQSDRSSIVTQLAEGLQARSLPQAVAKRSGQMKEWRTNIVKASGLSPVKMESLISAQAIEEMASFMVQGLWAPDVIHQDQPDMPLIFVNTFPDLGTHQLDDACLRFPKLIGLKGEDYGTIHLPGASRLAHALDKSKKVVSSGKMMTCGDPKGNANY